MPVARRPRPKRTWFQRLFLGFTFCTMVGAVGAAIALTYVKETVSSVPRTGYGATLAETPTEGEPLNFLLIGADSIDTLPEGHPLRASRSRGQLLTDTLIVLRIDPTSGTASVLSIPRDLWVPISGSGTETKINSVLAFTNRPTLAQTIQDYLGIPIHHVVQVDFNGFLEMIRVIDGIDVVVDYPLRDVKAQLDIPTTGCVTLTPEQSLGYVRSRTLQAFVDGQWQLVDGRADLGRIDRQQDFLVLAMQRAFDKGVRNPATLKGLVDDVFGGGFVTLDDRLTPDSAIALGSSFRDFRADSLQKYNLPVTFDFAGEQSIVRLVEGEAQVILDVFRGIESTQAIRLTVRNGTGEGGIASVVGTDLEAAGFRVVDRTDAESFDFDRTVIRFDESELEFAQLLEQWLGGGAELQQRPVATGVGVELVVGKDYAGVLGAPRTQVVTPTIESIDSGDGDGVVSDTDGSEGNGGEVGDAIVSTDDDSVEVSPTVTPVPAPGDTAAEGPLLGDLRSC